MKPTRAAVCLLTLVAAAATTVAQNAEERIRRVENGLLPPVVVKGKPIQTLALEDRMRELKIPGVSVAVFENGRLEWTRGWGMADVAEGRRVDTDTRFQAASISKPVAAAGALALVTLGQMSLDDDINKYLRSWKLPANEFTAKEKVTLARLLSHTGGVTVHGFRGYAADERVPTLLELLDGVKPANSAAIRVDIPVGTRSRYSGGGYSIAQLAIQDVTKKPFADALRELVLEPLRMSHSTFIQPLPAALRQKAATGYRASGDPIAGRSHTYPEQAAADCGRRRRIPPRSPPLVLTIEADGGKLFGRSGSTRFELWPEAAATFFATDNDARIEFVRGPAGKITEARVWQGGIERKAARQQ